MFWINKEDEKKMALIAFLIVSFPVWGTVLMILLSFFIRSL
ncbi:MAG: hypothetical protein BWY50_01532 [Spirochaetes bacterium ADurb.Bin315]|jgi:hypothetical protein|nr:MAG: hypothetical protein BWY50_01532 [Spirochaetes bacterium ADurb.Bin315]